MDSSGWSLDTGPGGTGLAAPSSARQEGNLRAFTRSGRERSLAERSFGHGNRLGGVFGPDRNGAIPGRGRKNLPVGGHVAVAKFHPVSPMPGTATTPHEVNPRGSISAVKSTHRDC